MAIHLSTSFILSFIAVLTLRALPHCKAFHFITIFDQENHCALVDEILRSSNTAIWPYQQHNGTIFRGIIEEPTRSSISTIKVEALGHKTLHL